MSTNLLDLTDEWVLGRDVVFTAVRELPMELRSRLECQEDDVAVSQLKERQPTRVVDLDMALLLEAFRSPCRIVDAVIAFSRARAQDPEKVLESAYPALCGFIANGLLRPPTRNGEEPAREGFVVGDLVGAWSIRRRLRILADTEVHQVVQNGTRGALKITGREPSVVGGMLTHEANVLQALGGSVAPRLLDQGTFEGRPFIVTEWCAGVPAPVVGEELRRHGNRAGMLSLCRSILRAYARLHAQGFLHGDVHPNNVLVAGDGDVRLIDFGLAHRTGAESERRGGVEFFLEPECVRAFLAGVRPPPCSERGEQYSLATLLYAVITGAQYLEFTLQREQGLRQIVEEEPRSFSQRGVDAWPEVEAVIGRALRKDPNERFPSVEAFEAALEGAEDRLATPSRMTVSAQLRQTKEDVLRTIRPLLGEGPPEAPFCSFNHGAAGIAYALYRMSVLEESA
ncbi:MAG TPA: protein kinase, partial [Candidatus Eisenbacteria bacterium]|nr:protein kinase [Candidatus Eisenbacteria bacterium]